LSFEGVRKFWMLKEEDKKKEDKKTLDSLEP